MEYRVQFASYWSEKNGEELTVETMSLEDARRWVSSRPQSEYVILQREADTPGSIWSLMSRENER